MKTKHTIFKGLSPYKMAHTLSVECFSLNKSTSYLSLCLSLNSFYNKISRTWASLGPETSYVISFGRLRLWLRFWRGPNPNLRWTVSTGPAPPVTWAFPPSAVVWGFSWGCYEYDRSGCGPTRYVCGNCDRQEMTEEKSRPAFNLPKLTAFWR